MGPVKGGPGKRLGAPRIGRLGAEVPPKLERAHAVIREHSVSRRVTGRSPLCPRDDWSSVILSVRECYGELASGSDFKSTALPVEASPPWA
jgi:hypothetical protein